MVTFLLMGALGLEVLALVAGAVLLIVQPMMGEREPLGASLFVAFFALGIAVLLVLCFRFLAAGRRWARSPLVTWQILQIAVGAVGVNAGGSILAWSILVVGLLAAGLLLSPTVTRATVPPQLRGSARPTDH